MGRPGSALRPGRSIRLGRDAEIETVAVREDGQRLVRFVGLDAAAAIARYGSLPLPPYIDRAPDARDEARYQTVYAAREGSVAAPTAGLHFTPAILAALEARGVAIARIDLEVGPGTFKPVAEESPASHPMHEERYEIPDAAPDAVRAAPARRADLGGGHHRRAGARERGRRDGRRPGRRRRHAPPHPARLRVQGGGAPAHQLPPSPLHPAHARERAAGPRADAHRVPPCRGR